MYSTPMEHSISMTGITSLTKTRYKQRHSGCKDIVQLASKGFVTLAQYKTLYPQEFIKKKAKRKLDTGAPKKKGIQTQIRQYRVNKKEVSHRIKGFVNAMKGEKMLYFWTVSFPLKTSDDTAHILLNKWMTRLRQEKLLKEYLWIAERQENGTIHFHIVINHKMDVRKANKYMRASIMYSINTGEIKYTREQAAKYNGIDIAKNRKTKRVTNFAKKKSERSLSNYLTKYVTKNDTGFSHLAWHSSREYSNLIIAVRCTTSELLKSGILDQTNQLNPLTGEYYIHYNWKSHPPMQFTRYLEFVNSLIKNILQ